MTSTVLPYFLTLVFVVPSALLAVTYAAIVFWAFVLYFFEGMSFLWRKVK